MKVFTYNFNLYFMLQYSNEHFVILIEGKQ